MIQAWRWEAMVEGRKAVVRHLVVTARDVAKVQNAVQHHLEKTNVT
jgi:hypothetical protein